MKWDIIKPALTPVVVSKTWEPVVFAVTNYAGIYFINPDKSQKHDSYYNGIEQKIPDPTMRTPLLGE